MCVCMYNCSFLSRPRCMVVLSPDPTPKRRKGSGTHQALSWACWCGISEFCRAMWLTCDYHVIPGYSQLLLHVRAVDALLCQYDALSWQSHDELRPVRPKNAQCVPDPFLLLGVWGLGTRLGVWLCACYMAWHTLHFCQIFYWSLTATILYNLMSYDMSLLAVCIAAGASLDWEWHGDRLGWTSSTGRQSHGYVHYRTSQPSARYYFEFLTFCDHAQHNNYYCKRSRVP